MKKILLLGGYGHQDIGDEAQLTTVIMNLKKFIPNSKLVILTDNVKNSQKYHDEEMDFSLNHYITTAYKGKKNEQITTSTKPLQKQRKNSSLKTTIIHFFSGIRKLLISLLLIFNAQRLKKGKKPLLLDSDLEHFLTNLKSCDLVFNVGGGNLNSIWRNDFWIRCLTFVLARIFEKPIILSGQTIGPFYSFSDKILARYTLNRVNVITLRESFSKEILQNIGVSNPLIKVTADDSVTLVPADENVIEKIFLKEQIQVARPLIGINIIGLNYLKKMENFNKAKELLAQIADKLIEKFSATIVIVPMQYGTDGDRIVASELLELINNKQRVFILSQELTDKETKGIISQLDFAIGFRYHFTVFALTSGVPAIGIYMDEYYSNKIQGIFSLMTQEKNCFSIEEATLTKILGITDQLFSNRNQITKSLNKKTEELQKQSLTTIKFAAKILSKQDSQ